MSITPPPTVAQRLPSTQSTFLLADKIQYEQHLGKNEVANITKAAYERLQEQQTAAEGSSSNSRWAYLGGAVSVGAFAALITVTIVGLSAATVVPVMLPLLGVFLLGAAFATHELIKSDLLERDYDLAHFPQHAAIFHRFFSISDGDLGRDKIAFEQAQQSLPPEFRAKLPEGEKLKETFALYTHRNLKGLDYKEHDSFVVLDHHLDNFCDELARKAIEDKLKELEGKVDNFRELATHEDNWEAKATEDKLELIRKAPDDHEIYTKREADLQQAESDLDKEKARLLELKNYFKNSEELVAKQAEEQNLSQKMQDLSAKLTSLKKETEQFKLETEKKIKSQKVNYNKLYDSLFEKYHNLAKKENDSAQKEKYTGLLAYIVDQKTKVGQEFVEISKKLSPDDLKRIQIELKPLSNIEKTISGLQEQLQDKEQELQSTETGREALTKQALDLPEEIAALKEKVTLFEKKNKGSKESWEEELKTKQKNVETLTAKIADLNKIPTRQQAMDLLQAWDTLNTQLQKVVDRLAQHETKLVTRLIPPDISHTEPYIGRDDWFKDQYSRYPELLGDFGNLKERYKERQKLFASLRASYQDPSAMIKLKHQIEEMDPDLLKDSVLLRDAVKRADNDKKEWKKEGTREEQLFKACKEKYEMEQKLAKQISLKKEEAEKLSAQQPKQEEAIKVKQTAIRKLQLEQKDVRADLVKLAQETIALFDQSA